MMTGISELRLSMNIQQTAMSQHWSCCVNESLICSHAHWNRAYLQQQQQQKNTEGTEQKWTWQKDFPTA